MIKLSLPKKNLLSMQLGVGLFFQRDAFDIERIIGDKMICSGFLSCNVDINLSSRTQNFNF